MTDQSDTNNDLTEQGPERRSFTNYVKPKAVPYIDTLNTIHLMVDEAFPELKTDRESSHEANQKLKKARNAIQRELQEHLQLVCLGESIFPELVEWIDNETVTVQEEYDDEPIDMESPYSPNAVAYSIARELAPFQIAIDLQNNEDPILQRARALGQEVTQYARELAANNKRAAAANKSQML